MSTSDLIPDPIPAAAGRPAPGLRALEAAALVVVFALLPEALHLPDGRPVAPHPGWIAVVILGARYGNGGFLAGVAAAAAAIGLGSSISGGTPAAAWLRLGGQPDLVALGASLGISWVASSHLRREAGLRERLRSLAGRAADAEEEAEALRGVVEGMRARVDRTSASLSFLRDAARRLEGPDPVAAAEGAADLALVRSGASVVSIVAGEGVVRRRLALRESGASEGAAPRDLHGADLLVPIQVGIERVGAIGLWGLPRTALDRATAHDLAVIASWCGEAIAAVGGPRNVADGAPGAP